MGHTRARLALPVIYLCAWAASILAIWMADTVGLMGAIILWLYLVMPAVTLGTSVAAALLNPYGRATWLWAPACGAGLMLVPYLTTTLANTLATGNVHSPDPGVLLIGTAISLVGLLVGRAARAVRRRGGGERA